MNDPSGRFTCVVLPYFILFCSLSSRSNQNKEMKISFKNTGKFLTRNHKEHTAPSSACCHTGLPVTLRVVLAAAGRWDTKSLTLTD